MARRTVSGPGEWAWCHRAALAYVMPWVMSSQPKSSANSNSPTRVVAHHPVGSRQRRPRRARRRRRLRRASPPPRQPAPRLRSLPSRVSTSRPSSRHDGSASIEASSSRSTPVSTFMNGLHVRQRVLAGSVDDRRHEVRQHRVGPLPAEQVEQLERLLGIDRAVAVRQQVIADDVGEPGGQLGRRTPGVDRPPQQRLRRLELLGLDGGPERRTGVGRATNATVRAAG